MVSLIRLCIERSKIGSILDSAVDDIHTDSMAYSVQQAKTNLSRLLQEVEEGKDVVIARGKKPAVRLVLAEQPALPGGKRILGKFSGQHHYSDEIFKPLETDEELREYGFDILIDGNGANEPRV